MSEPKVGIKISFTNNDLGNGVKQRIVAANIINYTQGCMLQDPQSGEQYPLSNREDALSVVGETVGDIVREIEEILMHGKPFEGASIYISVTPMKSMQPNGYHMQAPLQSYQTMPMMGPGYIAPCPTSSFGSQTPPVVPQSNAGNAKPTVVDASQAHRKH
jgi:hypothetical protein